VPLIADIHFHYKRGIEAAKAGAACLRINPGNIGSMDRVRDVVQAARDYGCAIRIGVNAGSLEKHLLEKYGEPCPDAMVESALEHARILDDLDFRDYKISVKSSDTFMTVAASLLWAGIGDTIRVSLSAEPEEEVRVGFDILKSLGLRTRGVNIIACPSCARQGFDVIRTVETLEARLAHIAEPISLSIIGCVVNGPGEALMTDLGFTGGGAGRGKMYVSGKPDHNVTNEDMVEHIVGLVEARAALLRTERETAEAAAQ
jgi:(E)-4-hydroxy-3-methylbut-2-enyl-diphosphate synthase